MIFKERQKRAMDTMNHRNKEVDDNPFSKDNLEKGDLPAMVISALLTFLPIILVIALIMIVSIKLLS